MHQILEQHRLAFFGVLFGFADHRVGHRTDPHRGRIAARVGDAGLLVGVVGARHLQAGIPGEDQFRPARGEFAAASRGARLDDDRTPLRRSRDGERSARGEEAPDVVEFAHFVGIGEHPGRTIVHDRVRVPGVPQPADHVEEFVGAVVALVVTEMGVHAEVLGLAVVDRGHHVPGRAAAGEVVEGGEGPGHVEGRVVGRGVGRAQPDPRGRLRQHAQDHAEVEFDRSRAVAHRLGHRARVDAGHGESVVEEHQVEAALLELPSDLRVIGRVEIAVLGGRMPPRTRVDRGVARLHERDQRHPVAVSRCHVLESNI